MAKSKSCLYSTRVTSAGVGKTPIAGAPQPAPNRMESTRQTPKGQMPRKNDPKGSGFHGLSIGQRVARGQKK